MYGKTKYWIECIECFLQDAGIPDALTPGQIIEFADCIDGANENMSLAFYQPESPLIGEVVELKRKLKIEESKVVCLECMGRGNITLNFGVRSSTSSCWKCHGEGYRVP